MAEIDYTKLLGDLGTDFEELSFESTVEEAIVTFVISMSDQLKANLSSKDKYYNNSDLKQSIGVLPFKVNGTRFTMSIELNYYADYLNKGVSGVEKKFDSPYSFKTLSVNNDFRDNLKRWITKRGFKLKSRYSQTRNLTKDKRKEKQINEKTQMAYAMGVNIKKKGIEGNHFIDEVVTDEAMSKFGDSLADLIGKKIVVTVKNKLIKDL
jgi:hypothetical protein